MKKVAGLIIFTCVACITFAAEGITDISLQQVQDAIEQSSVPHPRLFVTGEQLPEVMQRIQNSENLTVLQTTILQQADGFIEKDTLERKLTGRRLLGVSREALKRMLALSWA